MLEFTDTREYPASPDRLWAVFGQPDYVLAKYRALGSPDVRVLRFDTSAGLIDVELERSAPIDRVAMPGWARSLARDPQVLRHRSKWQREDPARVLGSLSILPAGGAVTASGAGTLEQIGPRLSRMRFDWQVRSSIPVLGPRVEHLFAGQVRAALAADHAFTIDYLRRH